MAVDKERKLKALMKLGMDEAEAKQVIEDDKKIDKGEKMSFDLTPEQAKVAKKYITTGTAKKQTAYKFKKERKRKDNPTKAGIISEIATFLKENSENACENVEITNKERQISFQVGENLYEFTLVQKRKPKS